MKPLYAGVSAVALLSSLALSTVALADDTATVQSVIVTGTRQTGVKAADSAAPIEVVGSEALKRTGAPDLTTALAASVPSFNVQPYGADTAALTVSAALRGLSPNETLTLVNGKRRHTTANLAVDNGSPYTGSAAVDLSYIPVAAIDHVEVLQDGAAAQYGSDAIAGVVNIILKKANHGGVMSVNGGEYFKGDGEQGDLALNRGFEIGDKGYFNLTGEVRYHNFSQRGGADARFFSPNGTPTVDPNGFDAGVVNQSGSPNVNHIYGDPRSTTYSLFFNSGYDAGAVELYAFGSYGHRIAEGYENYRKPSKIFGCTATALSSGGIAPGVVSFDSHGNPTGCTSGNIVQPLKTGFSPLESFTEDDYSLTAGAKGAIEGWSWDLSSSYGLNLDDVFTRNSANAQLFPDLQSVNTAPLNPQRKFYDGSYKASQWTTNIDLAHDYEIGLASPLNVSVGAEYRRDTYGIGAGDPSSYYGAGAQSFTGYGPVDSGNYSRSSYAGYLDLAVNPVKALHLDLAARTEHYSDFGDTTVGKLTGRYDISPALAFRGTASSGFRAPTLAEAYYSGTNVAPGFAFVQIPSDSASASVAGFQPLKPEKSTNISLGFVAHPMSGLQITGDLYQIAIKKRIINSGNLVGFDSTYTTPFCSLPANAAACQANPALVSLVSQKVLDSISTHHTTLDSGLKYAGIQIFSNGADTKTTGAEVTANYTSDFGDMGRVDWTLGVNYNSTKVQKFYPLPSQVVNSDYGQTQLETPFAADGLVSSTPKEKVVGTALWTYGAWTFNLRETVYGKTSQEVSYNGTGYPGSGGYTKVGTDITGITDLEVSYKVTSKLKVAGGADNLFDQKAPTMPTVSGSPADGNNVYNEPLQFTPWGINGGYYYAKATFTF